MGDFDVKLDILFCGVCHTDVHYGKNDVGNTIYPIVPGHEMVGVVTEVGSKVTKFKVGDQAGIGCISDSCLDCSACEAGDEQYCLKGKSVHSYNDKKRYTHIGGNPDSQTFGGYSGSNVLHEHFLVKIPDGVPLEKAGPIMCAGTTMYDPLKHFGAVSGKKMTIGIVGIGGLGTMGIKLARALGHEVIAISTSPSKKEMAFEKGAHKFIISTDPSSLAEAKDSIDLILNTISFEHDIGIYLSLLRYNGILVELGLVTKPHALNQMVLLRHRKGVFGSHIGGIKSTEECLELCQKHGIAPDIEHITASKIQWAWDQLKENKDGLRYVIDIKKSL